MRGVRAAHIFLAFSVWLVACDRTIVGPDHAAPLSTNTLTTALQAQGASVLRGPSLPRESHPYFSVNGQVLVVNNGDVTVYEYPTIAARDKRCRAGFTERNADRQRRDLVGGSAIVLQEWCAHRPVRRQRRCRAPAPGGRARWTVCASLS